MKKMLFLFFTFLFSVIRADFTVQVGSLNSENAAKRHISTLKSKIDTAKCYVLRSELKDGRIVFRVRFGRFRDMASAEKYKSSFIDKGVDSVVSRYEDPGYEISYTDDAGPAPLPDNTEETKIIAIKDTPAGIIKIDAPDDTKTKMIEDKTFEYRLGIINRKWLIAVQQEKEKEIIEELITEYTGLINEYLDSREVFKGYYMIAHCYLQIGDLDMTLRYLDRSIESAPSDEKAAIMYEKGFMVYIYQRDFQRAIDIFKRLFFEFPDSAWAHAAQNIVNEILKYKVYMDH